VYIENMTCSEKTALKNSNNNTRVGQKKLVYMTKSFVTTQPAVIVVGSTKE
jgi:hypothetical protein